MSLKDMMREQMHGARKGYTAEDAYSLVKVLQKVAPGLLSVEHLENMAQKGMIDYTQAAEAMKVAEAFAASTEAVKEENFLGDDFPANKFDAELIKSVGVDKVKVDAVLEIAKQKDPMLANTIYEVTNELDELTKKAIDKYGNAIDLVATDISTMLNNQDEVNFINSIIGKDKITPLSMPGDNTYKATGIISD